MVDLNGILKDKKILIIEDDESLYKRTERLFRDQGANVTVKSSKESALEELIKNGSYYNIIIIDIMLPATEDDLATINKLKKDLDVIRVELSREENKCNACENDIKRIRQRRQIILKEISELIDDEGGIDLIKNWYIKSEIKKKPPIVYFTAVSIAKEPDGKKAADWGSVEWLVKPVPSEKLLKTASELIRKDENNG